MCTLSQPLRRRGGVKEERGLPFICADEHGDLDGEKRVSVRTDTFSLTDSHGKPPRVRRIGTTHRRLRDETSDCDSSSPTMIASRARGR